MPDSVQRSTFDLEISMAKIEGMLTGQLTRHDQRLDQHENTLTQIDNRVREKGNIIARHDERIKDLEQDNDGRHGKFTGSAALIVSIVVAGLAIFNSLRIGP